MRENHLAKIRYGIQTPGNPRVDKQTTNLFPPYASYQGTSTLPWFGQCFGHKALGSTMKYAAVSDSQATEAARAALMGLY